jgi:hypothetical protein
MRTPFLLGALAFVFTFSSVPAAFAHHAFAAEFDQNKQITLSGTVTKVAWENPHAWFYMDVKDAKGQVVNWGFECGAPAVLFKQAWKKGTVKPGDSMTVVGYLAKSGANVAAAKIVTLPDGRKVMGGTPGDSLPASAGSETSGDAKK